MAETNWKRLEMTSIVYAHKLKDHKYIELVEKGNTLKYFCHLCCECITTKTALKEHLSMKNNEHFDKMWIAKSTLMQKNPWPFRDGKLFFSQDNLDHVDTGGENKVVQTEADALIIHGVLQKEVIKDLAVSFRGVGWIGALFRERGKECIGLESIWCEWLGKQWENDYSKVAKEHQSNYDLDFGIVTFPFNYDLGEVTLLKKYRKRLPDPEAEAIRRGGTGYSSSGKKGEFLGFQIAGVDDWGLLSRIFSDTTYKSMLDKDYNRKTGRKCDICLELLVPKKDVATLLNRQTMKLLCNCENGMFHVYHVSCLVLWVLIHVAHSYGTEGGNMSTFSCYQCCNPVQVDREACRKRLLDALKEWMKNPKPNDLKNNSVGLIRPLKDLMESDAVGSGDLKETVSSLKLLRFFSAAGM